VFNCAAVDSVGACRFVGAVVGVGVGAGFVGEVESAVTVVQAVHVAVAVGEPVVA